MGVLKYSPLYNPINHKNGPYNSIIRDYTSILQQFLKKDKNKIEKFDHNHIIF